MSSSKGKTTCKEVCSKCKCTVYERPLNNNNNKAEEKKQECVATIVGVLSLPENFCNNNNNKKEEKKDDNDCAEVYRDLGECLQKCIVKTSKSSKSSNGDCL